MSGERNQGFGEQSVGPTIHAEGSGGRVEWMEYALWEAGNALSEDVLSGA